MRCAPTPQSITSRTIRRRRWTAAAVLLLPAALLIASCAGAPGGAPQADAAGREAAGEGEATKETAAEETEEESPGAGEEPAKRREMEEEDTRPPQLSRKEFYRLVRKKLPERFLLLRGQDGVPESVFFDLDRNGYEDGFFLLLDRREVSRLLSGESSKGDGSAGAGSGGGEEAPEGSASAAASGSGEEGDAAERATGSSGPQEGGEQLQRVTTAMVSDMSGLLAEGKPAAGYYLAVYLQREEEIISMYRLPLGSWKVFESFGSLDLRKDETMPFCLTAAFQTQESTEHHWVIFYRYDKFSIFTFSDTIATHYEVRDIDDDLMLDVLEWHKVFEEGTGYETYITWYRWDGSSYSRYETTNVVRNLNAFLGRISRLLEAGRWPQLLEEALREDDLRRVQEADSRSARLSMLFRSEEGTPASTELRKVIFPSIFENPFSGRDGEKGEGGEVETVRFSARFVYRSGESEVRQCEVGMSPNPFQGREFFIVPRRP